MTTTTGLGELTGDYVLDPARTRIGFVARAALVARVRGHFGDVEGSAHLDGEDPARSAVRLSVRAGSVDTRNPRRDAHLRGGAFLDADCHPALSFASTAVERVGATAFRVTGDLTVRGVTGPVTVDLRLTGAEHDGRGASRVRFEGGATLSRADWGVGGGRGLVGGTVTVECVVAVVRR
ncbi:YceI family protein [Streptomyces sp. NPDC085946]|uniref:YceI family protein n=1 Tax=Streptomyces sp. NPDC085946 TaxID=3365744 RepID=UPI0037D740DB